MLPKDEPRVNTRIDARRYDTVITIHQSHGHLIGDIHQDALLSHVCASYQYCEMRRQAAAATRIDDAGTDGFGCWRCSEMSPHRRVVRYVDSNKGFSTSMLSTQVLKNEPALACSALCRPLLLEFYSCFSTGFDES